MRSLHHRIAPALSLPARSPFAAKSLPSRGASTRSLVAPAFALCLSGLLLLAAPDIAPAGEATGEAAARKPAGTTASISTAPDFVGQGVDGKNYRLSELLAKGPVLIDFWTTWCKPCMQELPHLQKIHDKYKARGFTLLGVASDEPRSAAKIRPTIASKGLKFPNVTDQDRRINNLYNVRNYPTTVLIASNGNIELVAQGYRPGDEVELEKRIVALLGGAATGGDTGSGGGASPNGGASPGGGVGGGGGTGAGESPSESGQDGAGSVPFEDHR